MSEQVPAPQQPSPDQQESSTHLVNLHAAIIREKEDPQEGAEPIPLWLVTVFFVILFWAGGYLFFYSGGFRPDVFDETQVTWGPVSSAQQGKPQDPVALGKKVFTANCAACHQASGTGIPGQYPTLIGTEFVLGKKPYGDNHLIKLVLNGLTGPITVNDKTYNGNMPAWKDVLKDEQIANVLTYIRQEWGNQAAPITKEAVAALRAQHGTRGNPWTDVELKQTPPLDVAAIK